MCYPAVIEDATGRKRFFNNASIYRLHSFSIKYFYPMTEIHIYKTIEKALSFRRNYINNAHTNAYRLINSYGDNLPDITIDIYGKAVLVQFFKTYEVCKKKEMYEAVRKILAPEFIIEKDRLKGKDVITRLISGKEIPEDYVVFENEIPFSISFSDGGGTGLYLDQRNNRKKVQSFASGKEVLNCFCYTSSFSVYACKGGAVKTTNIDLSRKAITWSKKNYSLNQIDINNHDFITGDVWEYFKIFQKKGREFDMIILDPPSFSTSKSGAFTVEKDFPELVGMGLNILRENGILVFSTNIAKVKISKMFQLLPKIKTHTKKLFKIIDISSQGLDFPLDGIYLNEPYLKFFLFSC
ncbi:MAG: class I SAM-dependent rRNA methyltransferase [Candidatus Kuenenia sp.]|nr:class I SAM-dependent rRNA methyltransferase [Candidatus Kuenenia hertensis]